MSDAALSPEDSQPKQKLESLVRTSHVLDVIRSLALPTATVGSLLSLVVGPGSFIAGAVLGATSIVAARAFNRANLPMIRKGLEDHRAKGTMSPEQYEKLVEILNSIEVEEAP